MERAGQAVADSVLRRFPDASRISVWCGPGANGGDGLVVARLLHEAGRTVEIRLLADEARVRGDAAENLGARRELGLSFVAEAGPTDVVVDALFGTGFAGSPRREAADAIELINALGDPAVAVDVPSGVDASTGEVARRRRPRVRDGDVPRAEGGSSPSAPGAFTPARSRSPTSASRAARRATAA